MTTRDTTGRLVEVTTGLTTTATGMQVVGLAIGDGPSAVVDLEIGARVVLNLRTSLSDLVKRRGGT